MNPIPFPSSPSTIQTSASQMNRREFLSWASQGLGSVALGSLLLPSAKASPHLLPRAKRAIQFCLVGGLSHIDSFDHKPDLDRLHGKSLETQEKPDIFFGQVGRLRKSDFPFKNRGQSGLALSDLFPRIADQADDLCLIRSMTSDSANHTPALFLSNSGFQFNGYPTLGAWFSYGLGTENENLPTYVVLPDQRGDPNGGANSWTNGFLPAINQGVKFFPGDRPVRDLYSSPPTPPARNQAILSSLNQLNQIHQQRTELEDLLTTRIRSYQLAAQMQLSVPGITDLSKEPESIKNLYGIANKTCGDTAYKCLLARRLLEQGVRFIQIFSGGPIAGSPRSSWDAHENVLENHGAEAQRIDQPIAALLVDLKQRGMLDDTLVLFTTEFGRTPFAQSSGNETGPGRDHNKYAFSSWMAGAGVRGGLSYGSSDDIGWKVASNPVTWHDFHATVLAIMGLDHQKLTFYHNGIQRRLTNVHGEILHSILT